MQSYIQFGLIDYLAKSTATVSSDDKKTFVDLSQLNAPFFQVPKIATFEADLWKLDGSFVFRKTTDKLAYISESMSNGNGYFRKNMFNKNADYEKYGTSEITSEPISTGIKVTINFTSSSGYRSVGYKVLDMNYHKGQQFTIYFDVFSTGGARKNVLARGTNEENSTAIPLSGVSSFGTSGDTFTIPNEDFGDNHYLLLKFYVQLNTPINNGDYVEYSNLQLELGSTATDYEAYQSNPKLTMNFNANVEASGLTLKFPETNIAESFLIKWSLESTVIDSLDVDDNNLLEYVIDKEEAEIYDKLEIEFIKTKDAYRHARLNNIEYGIIKIFTNEELVSALAINETSLVSAELMISSLDFSVYSQDAEFSLLNPTGLYAVLEDRQAFDVFKNDAFYGVYYLKDWKTIDNNNYTFNCEDAIGTMANNEFMGDMYTEKNAKDLVTEIVEKAGFEADFQSDNIDTATVTGWIPICDCRKALQSVLFACKCIATTEKSRKIIIKDIAVNTTVTAIDLDDMYSGEKLSLRPLVTAIRLIEHTFNEDNNSVTIFDGKVEEGETTITFPEPHHTYDSPCPQTTIIESGANYVKINRTSTGDCEITGKSYIDNKKIKEKALLKYIKSNIVKVDDAYLVSADNSTEILDYLFDFYQQRIERTITFDNKNPELGDIVEIETIFEEVKNCIFETIEFDIVAENQKGVAIIYELE
jgi:hypothetical protein